MRKSGLLKRVASVAVPAVQRFVAGDCLKEANVGWTGDNFKRLFLDKIGENVPEANLAVSRLEEASLDAPILKELGDRAEVSLAHMFDLLKRQAHGEEGILLTNGYANIFYVHDRNNTLWAVSARWDSARRDWYVEAHSIKNPNGWSDGHLVFSRDS